MDSQINRILDVLPMAVYYKDLEGTYTQINEQAKILLKENGYETDIIGKKDIDIFPLDIAQQFRAHDLKVMTTDQKICEEEEVPIKNGRGQMRNQLSTKWPLKNDTGAIIGIVGTTLDISFIKQKQNILQNGMQAFNNILYYLPGFVYWKDKNSVYLGCNENFAKAAGLNSVEEILGKTDYDLAWGATEADLFRKGDQEVLTGHEKYGYEEPQLMADGRYATVLATKVALLDEKKKPIGVLGIYNDITDRKKMEEDLKVAKETAEAASAAKTEFIRNMSHDLRTPLTGIIGMADMIDRMPEMVSVGEGAKDIHQAGTALLNLLNEIIETTQIESGTHTHKKTCFALKTTINALTAIFKPAIKQKGLTLETFYDDNIPEILFGQELLLHRVILNLLGNAVKFTTHGTISLEVSLSQKTSEKAILKILVKDTGSGIPADKQNIIFDKFSRLAPSYSNNYQGSGLGLYMVKEFIKKLGGDIKVNSTLGNGAQFTCNVQFKIPTSAQLKKYQPIPRIQPVMIAKSDSMRKLRVLLVEDTLLPRKIAKSLLNIEGYEVVTAETAEEAIEKSTQNIFDLIYMDIGLPDGTGIEVAKDIRANPENPNRNTFIVALTAHLDPEIKKECLNAGIQEVFDKPLNLNKIEAIQLGMNSKQRPCSIDLISTTETLGGNDALTKQVLSMFMLELPNFQKQITEAFTTEDLPALKQHVHKLHGALCYIGLPRLKAVISHFEKQLINQVGDYKENYQVLMHEIEFSFSEYNKLLNKK